MQETLRQLSELGPAPDDTLWMSIETWRLVMANGGIKYKNEAVPDGVAIFILDGLPYRAVESGTHRMEPTEYLAVRQLRRIVNRRFTI